MGLFTLPHEREACACKAMASEPSQVGKENRGLSPRMKTPLDAANDLLKDSSQQKVISRLEWERTLRNLIAFYALNYVPKSADDYGNH